MSAVYKFAYVLFTAICVTFMTLLTLNLQISPETVNATMADSSRFMFPLPKERHFDENRQKDGDKVLNLYYTKSHSMTDKHEGYDYVLRQIGEILDAYNHNGTSSGLGLLKNPDRRICSKDGPESVEDLLCKKPIRFLPNFKNPCWYTPQHRLVCLPYFQLIGLPKCASTDVFHRLCLHPDVLPNNGRNNGKETQWWAWDRYGKRGDERTPFEFYLQYFATAASTIEETVDGEGKHNRITGDGSPMDFWDMKSWPRIPQNSKLAHPKVLTPHLLRHINPDVKLILVLRDPVDRQYSDYWFINPGKKNKSDKAFHSAILKAIGILHTCTRLHSLRWCLFDKYTYGRLHRWARLSMGFYSIYLREWLKAFPQDQFLFLQTEQYSANISEQMKRVFRFLKLRDLSESEMQKIVERTRDHVTKKKQTAKPMLEETKQILHKLYDPFTVDLAAILNDKKFTWNVTLAQ